MVFIVLDGLDASGKSTQACFLYDSLRCTGRTVYLRFHPANDNFFGVKAKEFLYSQGKSAHLVAAVFYMVDILRSILLFRWWKYDYTIFVRYLMGTAYLPSPLDLIAYLFFASLVPTSDMMFFLDVDPEEAFRRIRQSRGRRERFENPHELRRIRRKALILASIGRWRIVDSNKPVKEVEKEIGGSLRTYARSPRL